MKETRPTDDGPAWWRHVVRVPRIRLVWWLKQYRSGDWKRLLGGDLGAGVVVAVMLVPQALAYAALADVDPVIGLYAAIASLLTYPLFASSPHLAVGPTAVMSLLTSAAVSDIVSDPEDLEAAGSVAAQLALLVGVIQLAMGVLRVGFVTNFLSHAVLKGFSAAAAVIIAVSQLAKLLGVSGLKRSPHVYTTLYRVLRDIGRTNGPTLAIGLESLALLIILKALKRRMVRMPWFARHPGAAVVAKSTPNALIVVVFNILLVKYGDLSDVKVVGDIDSGLPSPTNVLSDLGDNVGVLLPSAIAVSLVGFLESISVAEACALKYGGQLIADQELAGLGVANAFGSFFGAFPTTGGFSRSLVQADSGSETPITGLIAGGLLIIVVQFLTSAVYHLPDATLSAIIVFAVVGLIDVPTARYLWHCDRQDFAVYALSLVFTLALGIEEGIIVGLVISLLRFIKNAASPHVAVLGQMPDGSYRNVRRFPEHAKPPHDMVVLRFDGPLFFGNATKFNDVVLAAGKGMPSSTPPRGVVVDASAVSSIDSAGLHTLHGLPAELAQSATRQRDAHLRSLRAGVKRAATDDERRTAQRALAAAEAQPLAVPELFVACVRGPVRDMIHNSNAYVEARRRPAHSRRRCCAAVVPTSPAAAAPAAPPTTAAGAGAGAGAGRAADEAATQGAPADGGDAEEQLRRAESVADGTSGWVGAPPEDANVTFEGLLELQDVGAAVVSIQRRWERQQHPGASAPGDGDTPGSPGTAVEPPVAV